MQCIVDLDANELSIHFLNFTKFEADRLYSLFESEFLQMNCIFYEQIKEFVMHNKYYRGEKVSLR